MKLGIDTRIGNFVAVVREPAPFARYARRSALVSDPPLNSSDDVPKNRGDRRGSDAVTAPFQRISNFGCSIVVSTNSAKVGLKSG